MNYLPKQFTIIKIVDEEQTTYKVGTIGIILQNNATRVIWIYLIGYGKKPIHVSRIEEVEMCIVKKQLLIHILKSYFNDV